MMIILLLKTSFVLRICKNQLVVKILFSSTLQHSFKNDLKLVVTLNSIMKIYTFWLQNPNGFSKKSYFVIN